MAARGIRDIQQMWPWRAQHPKQQQGGVCRAPGAARAVKWHGQMTRPGWKPKGMPFCRRRTRPSPDIDELSAFPRGAAGRSQGGGARLITPDFPGGWSAPPGTWAQVLGGADGWVHAYVASTMATQDLRPPGTCVHSMPDRRVCMPIDTWCFEIHLTT